MGSQPVKVCPKCGGERTERLEPDGRRWRCDPCVREKTRAWTKTNPDRKKANDRARRATPAAREKKRAEGVSEAHRERVRAWGLTDSARAYRASYYKKHRDKVTARVRAYQRLVKDRPESCPACGECPAKGADGRSLIQFHHHSGYSKESTFVGAWLCVKCHGKEHRKYP